MKNLFFPLIIICFVLTVNTYSQQKQLAQNEFYTLVNAVDKQSFASRRETRKDEAYEDGKLSKTTIITREYIKPNKEYFVSIENSGGKTEKLEVIIIGENYYQRKNDGAWMRIKEWYGNDGIMTANPGSKTTFTVEEVDFDSRRAKLYTAIYTYKNEYLDKNGLSFTRIKSWIADDKILLKEEIVVGALDSQKIAFRRTYDYEYNPKNLKIEIPVTRGKAK